MMRQKIHDKKQDNSKSQEHRNNDSTINNSVTANLKEEKMAYHIPVLLQETITGLHIKPGGVYVDCTMGGAGHAREILKYLNADGRLIVFDQDADAELNAPDDERVTFVPHNFRHLNRFLKLHNAQQVDGVLADLGVSSHQFDAAERGFSFRHDALLDMRMNQRQSTTASDIANSYPADRLQQMLSLYGEVTNAKTLALAIIAARQEHPYKTIRDLTNVLSQLSKGNPNRYYAQVFQAFRIEVNEEMEALKEMLIQLPQSIKPGGRVAIITFHSLEDRMVKIFFKQGNFGNNEEDPVYGNRSTPPFRIITKKPIEPTAAELKLNPRSRSAKLRVAEKVGGEWSPGYPKAVNLGLSKGMKKYKRS